MRSLAVCLMFHVASTAQEVLWERTGQVSPQTAVGTFAKFVGDIDGDGFDDMITLAWRMPRWTQELWLLSGRDGRTLRTQQLPPRSNPYFIDYGPAGDVDGDGVADYVFSSYENSPPWLDDVWVHSGRDGSLIWNVSNTSQVFLTAASHFLGGRDITGDSRPDLIVLWHSGSGNPAGICAFDHTGRLLYRHVGTPSLTYQVSFGSSHPGNAMGWVGDVDGDGIDDFTLGGTVAGTYATLVLSGRTGLHLRSGYGTIPNESIGVAADGCGDIDGDGVPDFAGASGGWIGEQGQVHVFSGRDGSVLRSWLNVWAAGALRGGGKDFDRDGVPDLIFWRSQVAGSLGTGGMYVCSGRDAAWTHRVLDCPTRTGTSRTCAYLDLDWSSIDVGRPQPGNPYPVFVVNEGEYGETNGDYLGRIRLYRGTPPGVEPIGMSCAGTLPTTPQMGLRDLQGRGVRLHLSRTPPAAHVALLLGFSRTHWHGLTLPASLAPLGLPSCSLYTSVDLFAKTWTGAAGLERGYANVDLPLPLRAPGQELFTLHAQWLVWDANTGALGVSDAIAWRH